MLPASNDEANSSKNGKCCLIGLITVVVAITIFVFLHSLERQLDPKFVGSVRLDPTQVSADRVAREPWHTVYEADDNCSGSWYHPHEYYQSCAIDPWPEMDLENYAYIITYCRKIRFASYYLCREIVVPIRTGEKEAHLILADNVEPLTIYVYQIPKIRINNPDIY